MQLTSRFNKHSHLPSLCLTCLLTGGTLSSLSAQTAATWNGGTGNWSNDALWSTGAAPNGAGFDVFIDGGKTGTASVVTMDGSYGFGRLTLDADDTLNVTNGNEFTVINGAFAGSGSLVNNGTINLNSTGNGANLRFSGAGTISGTGTINLNGSNVTLFTNGGGDRVTIGTGQTIAGTGNLGGDRTAFTNQGTITANQNGNTLVLQPGNSTAFTNTGSGAARAENGGVLELYYGTFSGGSFTALAGSRVQVDSVATVSGATLASVGTGTVTINGGTLNNVMLSGSVSVVNGAEPTINGTLTNNGALSLNSAGDGVALRFGGPATLAGTGTINLTGNNVVLLANNAGDRLTVGSNQTIQGVGSLGGNRTTFTNSGTINANQSGGTLTLAPGGGTADFTNNGTLSAFLGGTLAFNNSSSGAALTNNGTLSAGAGNNSTITIPAGALTNLSGTTLTGGTYNVTGAGTNSPATLSLGGGAIVTNNARVNLSGAGSVFTEINALANNQGTFTISNGRNFTTASALTNFGLLTSSSGSNLTVAGNLTNSGLVGTAFTTTAATIVVQGTLASSGLLVVSTYDTVSATTAINVSSAGQIIASGTLTAPTFTLAGALRPGDGINFTTRNVTPVAGAFTLNGRVNLMSTTALVFDLGNTLASDQIRVNGTLTLDGTLTVNALAGFGACRYDLINYTGTLTDNTLDLGMLPAGYSYSIDTSRAGEVDLVVSVVPEPSTWAALLAGTGLLVLTLRRRVAGRG